MAAFAFALASAIRVASLDLCADEYLLTLARPEEIAAVSRLSQDPAESPLWRRAKSYPPYRGRIETLIPLRPTLLLAVGGTGGRSTRAIARRMGWRFLVLPYPTTPDDVAANLDRLAGALGRPRDTSWRRRLAALRQHVPAPTDTIFLSGGGQSVAPDGLSAAWMRLAGYRQRPLPGSRVTLEELAVHPPAVLLRSDYRSGQLSLGRRWLDHPLVRANGARQVRTDGRPWTCGGPLMFGEIRRLRSSR